ncbi:MAG: lamin tail domain-containing protein [Planctomycetota bacterium]
MKTSTLMAALAAGTLGTSASAALFLNEVLASTTGADSEFIEIYNSGSSAVDLTGYTIDEIESDAAGTLGTVDDTFVIPDGASVPAGGYYVIGNAEFETAFGFTSDLTLPISIENSSYTLILKDALGAAVYTAFSDDGDGVPQGTPDISIPVDGTFLAAGYYLVGDGGSTAEFLEFSPKPAASATPGAENLPEPATAALLGLGALAMLRRRSA